MIAARVVLGLVGAMYGGFGAWLLVRPTALRRLVGIQLPTAASRVEVRTFYGGLELGLAALAFVGIVRRTWTGAALTALAMGTGGAALGRLAGLLVEGTIERSLLLALGVETSSALASGLAALTVA